MIQFIKNNYNMCPSKIYKKNNTFFFFSNDEKIYILKSNKDKKELDEMVSVSNKMFKKTSINTFILNTKGEYYTYKDNEYIILLKSNNCVDSNVTLESILKYNIINGEPFQLKKIDIISEWEKTIDTIENEMTEYNKEFPIIQESLNYFIGISENAIQMLKEINFEINSIGFNISLEEFNCYEMNNPLNLVKVNKMHNVAMYFKYNFYNNYVNYDEIYDIIQNNKKEDLIYLFCSMLFQKEYFDDVKNILLNNKDEKILFKYIKRINDYKKMLLNIKNSLHNISEINEIKWIEK